MEADGAGEEREPDRCGRRLAYWRRDQEVALARRRRLRARGGIR